MKHSLLGLLEYSLPLLGIVSVTQGGGYGGFSQARLDMVQEQLRSPARGIRDERVLSAMTKVARHELVPVELRGEAYADHPLPIGHGQTISQPYIVAFMSQALEPEATDKVLEIGTGSGYQAAVLAEIVAEVYTIEIVETLAARAEKSLQSMGYTNIFVKAGDGYEGWPSAAPFDCIIVTCAPENIPQPLIDQLRDNGRMIIPVGPRYGVQELVLLRKQAGILERQAVLPVRFVPMTGQAQKP